MNKRIKAESQEDLQILLEKVFTDKPEEARCAKVLIIDIPKEKNAFHIPKSIPLIDLQGLLNKLPELEEIKIVGVKVGKLKDTEGKNRAIEKATLHLENCDQDVVSWFLGRSPNLKYLSLKGASAKNIAKLNVKAEDSKLDHIVIDLETCANELLTWFGEHCPNISTMTIDGFTKNSFTVLNGNGVQYREVTNVEIRTEKCSKRILPWLQSHCPHLIEIYFYGPMEKFTECVNTEEEKILSSVKKVAYYTDNDEWFSSEAVLWICDYFPSLALIRFNQLNRFEMSVKQARDNYHRR